MMYNTYQAIENTVNIRRASKIINFAPRISLNLAKMTRNRIDVKREPKKHQSMLKDAWGKGMLPVYVSRYEVTTQSLVSKPLRAFVILTRLVLTIVVSKVESSRLEQRLWIVMSANVPSFFKTPRILHRSALTQVSTY
jgi:hypothetical protein